MKPTIKITVVALIVVILAGIGVMAIFKLRHYAKRYECEYNLLAIGLALHNHHSTYQRFPAGTVPNSERPPPKRLSWLVRSWPYLFGGSGALYVDESLAWDDEENCPPMSSRGMDDSKAVLVGDLPELHCPANTVSFDPSMPSPTHFIGIAGVGENAAELPLSDPAAGFFGYDRKLPLDDIKDGTANTFAVIESPDGGPWTAGGHATVRGLIKGRQPYFGTVGQFASNHPYSVFAIHDSGVTKVLFADGSIRPFAATASPELIEAMATIAGGEQIGR